MNEDELAKGAVLLAHAPPDVVLPKQLERRILQSVPTRQARATTTRSAVVELIAAPPSPPSSLVRDLAPWCLAAACFAFAVFEWRSAAVLHQERAPAASASAAAVALVTRVGGRGATLEWDAAQRTGALRIEAHRPWLAAGPFEHQTLWGRSVEGAAQVLASKMCAGSCLESDSWTLVSAVPLREPLDIWMTAAASDGKVDTEKPTVLLSTRWPRDEE